MKAIVYSNYGSPDALRCEEIEKSTAGDDEVLIKVRAASVNPVDWHLMRGTPYILRIQAGLRKSRRCARPPFISAGKLGCSRSEVVE